MAKLSFDSDFVRDRKVSGLSDVAFRLHVVACCDSVEWELDGHVPMSVVERFSPTRGKRIARELVDAGVWFADGSGFRICADVGARASRRSIVGELRQRIIARDGLVCGLCGSVVAQDDVHIDHIHPVVMGGGNRIGNLRVTHSRCNLRRPKRPAGDGA